MLIRRLSIRHHPLPLLLAALGLALAPAAARAQGPERVVGEVVAADGGSAAGLVVRVRSGAFADSAAIDSDGRFRVALPALEPDDSVEVVVDAAAGTERTYHPALARVAARELEAEQRFVLAPRRWTIAQGAMAGTGVEISLHRAFGGFYARDVALSAKSLRVRSWPQRAFPLRVAFDREYSRQPIAARDSSAFWGVVGEIEAAFGSDLFRPARYFETVPVGGRYDHSVLVAADPGLSDGGITTLITERGEILHAAISLRRRPSPFGPGNSVVAHELMHALGFGHTCAWRSVLADTRRCELLRAETATPEDVAYAQLFLRVRALQRERGARWGLEAALAGERALVLGLPAEEAPAAPALASH